MLRYRGDLLRLGGGGLAASCAFGELAEGLLAFKITTAIWHCNFTLAKKAVKVGDRLLLAINAIFEDSVHFLWNLIPHYILVPAAEVELAICTLGNIHHLRSNIIPD
tara:strand:- start:118 stop:438 length:321 start_codon:yes stop_codon:yes gene_type:complete